MNWDVKYNAFGEVWHLKFPPHVLCFETDEFLEYETMADVLADAIQNFLAE